MNELTNETTPVATTQEEPPTKRGRPYLIAPEVFTAAWAAAGTLDEVATNLGITKVSASVKASQLRRKGYELTMFKRGRRKGGKEQG
jgi:hypothetical protein